MNKKLNFILLIILNIMISINSFSSQKPYEIVELNELPETWQSSLIVKLSKVLEIKFYKPYPFESQLENDLDLTVTFDDSNFKDWSKGYSELYDTLQESNSEHSYHHSIIIKNFNPKLWTQEFKKAINGLSNSIIKLNFHEENLDKNKAREIVKIFSACTNMKSLNFKQCSLNNQIVQCLANTWKEFQHLTVLNLSYNKFHNADCIAASLRNLTKLQYLNLNGNNFGHNITVIFKNITNCIELKVLKIAKNNINEDILKQINSAALNKYKNLNYLDLSHNPINDSGILSVCLILSPNFKKLKLRNIQLSTTGLHSLASKVLELNYNDPHLYLDVSENNIKFNKLETFDNNIFELFCRIKGLNIANQKKLLNLTSLFSLDKKFELITHLNIKNSTINYYLLGDYITKLNHLVSIKIGGIKDLGKYGMLGMRIDSTMFGIYKTLIRQVNLEEIDLEGLPLTMEARYEFSDIFIRDDRVIDFILSLKDKPKLKYLNLNNTRIGDIADLELGMVLPKIPNLQDIRLAGFSEKKSWQSILIPLTKCHKLRLIDLSNCNATPDDIIQLGQALNSWPYLTKIIINGNKINFDIDHLLRMIHLLKSEKSYGVFSSSICKNFEPDDKKLLVRFSLHKTESEKAAIAELIKHNKVINELTLSNNLIDPNLVTEIANALKINTALKKLSLYNNDIGPKGAKALAEAIKYNKVIEKLFLGRNNIGSQGAVSIANALKINSSIICLYIEENNIGDEGVKAIAESIKTKYSIQELNLYQNNIGDEGAKAIGESIKNKPFIQKLNLTQNNISDEGAKAIAEGIKNKHFIQELNLTQNNISDEGAKAIAEGIKSSKTITKFFIPYNKIGSAGATSIANAFHSNTSLKELSLNSNPIGVEGAKAIAKLIKQNQVITKLYLGNICLGSEGATHIANALRNNTSIKELALFSNSIDAEGAKAIAEAIRHNKSITRLNLGYNKIGSIGAIHIANALRVNTSIIELDLEDNQIDHKAIPYLAEEIRYKNINLAYNNI